jgi:hypothetical protein
MQMVLKEEKTGRLVIATLQSSLSPSYFEWVDSLWQPVQEMLLEGQQERPEHAHWRWAWKLTEYSIDKVGFAVEHEGIPQAVMIAKRGNTARLSEQTNQPLLYIDYLATAPWNNTALTQTPRYRLCGTALWKAAIKYSQEQGWEGRVGLHSLRQSEGFYRDVCQMSDLGHDPDYDNLRYFEWKSDQ